MTPGLWRAAAGIFLATAIAADAGYVPRTQVLTSVDLEADGIVREHPCNEEPLVFGGSVPVEASALVDDSGALVGLQADLRRLVALGQKSSAEHRDHDYVTTTVNARFWPKRTPVVLEARYHGPTKEAGFWADVRLDVSVDRDGKTLLRLRDIDLRCER